LDGVAKVTRDLGKRSHKEVAEIMPFEPVSRAKAVREQLCQQVALLTERDHTVAQVSGRQHIEVFSQATGGSAVVGNRNHRGQVGDLSGHDRELPRLDNVAA